METQRAERAAQEEHDALVLAAQMSEASQVATLCAGKETEALQSLETRAYSRAQSQERRNELTAEREREAAKLAEARFAQDLEERMLQAQGQSSQAIVALTAERQALLQELRAERVRGQEERENWFLDQRDLRLAWQNDLVRLRSEQAQERVASQLELDAAMAHIAATADPCPELETDSQDGTMIVPSPSTEGTAAKRKSNGESGSGWAAMPKASVADVESGPGWAAMPKASVGSDAPELRAPADGYLRPGPKDLFGQGQKSSSVPSCFKAIASFFFSIRSRTRLYSIAPRGKRMTFVRAT